ncbi:hypothetical protein Tco_0289787 [Tanacetum coccineum]
MEHMRLLLKLSFGGFQGVICAKIYDETDFKEKLNKIYDETDFKENHKWLTKMFNIRSTWIPAYFIDSPLCGLMRTTSRSETMEKQRHVQERMDHKTIESLRPFLRLNVMRLMFTLVRCLKSPYVYEMPSKRKKKPQSVDKGNDKAEENDKVDMFFKKDRLYKVLWNNANVEMIPQQYILSRWTKNLIPTALRNKRNRYGEKNVVVENYGNEATSISLKKEVEADCPNPTSKNTTDNLEQLVGVPKPPVVDVNNPTVGSTKGRKKLRIKGRKEKAIEKNLKGRNPCSLCGGTDHNKRTCPRRFEGQDEVMVQKEVGQEEVLVQKEVCQEEVVQEKVDLAEDEEELSEEDEDLIHE